ncbi:MAG: hypothetical protein H6710_11425 [Myxococcales bacterium]|nr:hypothetical protein [Myxococcales bacterium]
MRSEPPPLVVGVGASAGGLAAFKVLLASLPADTALTLLLVQHRDVRCGSALAELLQEATSLPIVDVDAECVLDPATIYVLRPDLNLSLRSGHIELVEGDDDDLRLPVDRLFRALADAYGGRAVGVVLTGHGADGSAGLREIKAAGGLAIAQDPASAEHPEMPQRAIDTGLVDLVLELSAIPAALERFARLDGDASPSGEASSRPQLSERALRRIANALHEHLDVDLGAYKPGTLSRRIRRRIALAGLDDLDAYLHLLRDDPVEQQRLARDLLISVTSFFRDPAAFHALRSEVIEPLIAHAAPDTKVRVWVAACATGEEAYSLGIELLEAMSARGLDAQGLQIFATDVSEEALAIARAGIYPPTIAERVSERRLAAFFTPVSGGYKIVPRLRDAISFAAHDLTKDPPFSKIDLVSCRNVLIYLSHEAQRRVLESLHFALAPDGYLVLSASETIGPLGGLFQTISKPWRIYRKDGTSRPILHQRARRLRQASGPRASVEPPLDPGDAREAAPRALLRAWAPPTLVIGADDRVHFMHGALAPYLRFPEGEPRFEFRALIRPELAARARGALHRCRCSGATVEVTSSPDLDGPPVRTRPPTTAIAGRRSSATGATNSLPTIAAESGSWTRSTSRTATS